MSTSYTNRLGTSPEEGIKAPCVTSTSANITLSGEQTIGGLAVVAGNRVLVRSQTDNTENGIYVCAAGAWPRATDFNAAEDVVSGVLVLDVDNEVIYKASFNGSYVAGTTAVVFSDIFSNSSGSQHQRFTSTANQTVFTGINEYTVNVGAIFVAYNGSVLSPDDFTQDDPNGDGLSTQITLDTALQAGQILDVWVSRAPVSGETALATNVSYVPSGTDAVARNVQNKLREFVSAKDFGVKGDGVTDDRAAILLAWNYCIANGVDLYFPSGTYICTDANFPFRQSGTPTSLLDCNNITVYGNGPTTIFKTSSVDGADVLQLNGLKNVHFRNLKTQAAISGSAAGSNGISVTNGFDNVTLLDIYCKDMPSLDKTSYADGGKALTVQPSTTVNDCGTLVARIIADGCSAGFGYDLDLVTATGKNTSITVDLVAMNCYRGVVPSAGAATGAISDEADLGIRVRGTLIDCQQDVVLGRVHGCDIDVNIVTSKTIAARRLDPNGVAWLASNTEVSALNCLYAKNSKISIKGNKGDCDYKARIGGAAAGSSGLNGATEFCEIYLDIPGTSVTSDIDAVDNGGNSMSSSELKITSATSSTLPSNFAGVAKLNQLVALGSYGNSILSGNIQFPATQVPSADPNCLDDYEEGVFTPVLSDTSLTDEGATYSIQNGYYTKIGNRVFFTLYIALTGKGTLTAGDAAFITGLPFSNRNSTGNIASCTVGFCSGLTLSAAATVNARIGANVSYITLSKWLATSTTGDASLLVSDLGTTASVAVSGVYHI